MKNVTEEAMYKCRIPVVGDYVKLNGVPCNIEHLFLNNYYTEIRSRVRSSYARMSGDEDSYLGYVYKGTEGRYIKYYLTGGIENVARFICSSSDNKLLCNSSDYPLLCSIGDYLDLIKSDSCVKDELIECLKKYQGKKERPVFSEM